MSKLVFGDPASIAIRDRARQLAREWWWRCDECGRTDPEKGARRCPLAGCVATYTKVRPSPALIELAARKGR